MTSVTQVIRIDRILIHDKIVFVLIQENKYINKELSCGVKRCRSESYRGCGISFFKIPKDEKVRQRWVRALPGQDKDFAKKAVICHLHFKPDDFFCTPSFRPRLKLDAVPSVCFTPPKHYNLTLEEVGHLHMKQHVVAEHNYASKESNTTETNEIKTECLNIPTEDMDTDSCAETNTASVEQKGCEVLWFPDVTTIADEESVKESITDQTTLTAPAPDLSDYKHKYELENYKKGKLLNPSYKQKIKIKNLQRKVKLLQMKLKRKINKQDKTKCLRQAITQYTSCTEIDNILKGRFKELHTMFGMKSKTPKFSDEAMQFAIKLYYTSSKSYKLVRNHIELPTTKQLIHYLTDIRRIVINKSEFE